LVVAIDEREKILEIVELARKHFPHLKILARAIDRRHAYELIRHGVDTIHRETFGSALEMGVDALKLLGVRAYRAHRAAQTFKHYDEEALHDVATLEGDETVIVARSRQLAKDLERLLQSDERERIQDDRAWDISDLRKETR
jgi:voltage-gated potassium channel Kch